MLNITSLTSVALFGFPLMRIKSLELQAVDLSIALTVAALTVAFGGISAQPALANSVAQPVSTRAADLGPVLMSDMQQCQEAAVFSRLPVVLPPLSPPSVPNLRSDGLAVPESLPPVGLTQPLSAQAISQTSRDTCAGGQSRAVPDSSWSIPMEQQSAGLFPSLDSPKPAPDPFLLILPLVHPNGQSYGCSGPGVVLVCMRFDSYQTEK